jgi:small subunit ribosomal protein S6
MLMTEYETTLVVRPDVGGDVIESTLDRVRDAVKSRNGKLLAINHWGKKKLAYPIMKHNRGIYVHTVYLGRDDMVTEIERNLRIADSVLRFLTVKVETGVDPESRREQDYVAPQYDADESTAEPGAEAAEAAGSSEASTTGTPEASTEAAGASTEATEDSTGEAKAIETSESPAAEAAPAEPGAPAEESDSEPESKVEKE